MSLTDSIRCVAVAQYRHIPVTSGISRV